MIKFPGLLALVLLAATSCGQRPPEPSAESGSVLTPEPGDMLVDASIGDASKLNPILAADSASGDIANRIFNGLVKYDKDIRLTGDLARSWDVSPDGLTLTFHLRPGVQWQDGKPFTARDVEFTYRTLIDPKTQTPYSSTYTLVSSFQVVDDLTVRVAYAKPFAPALESWAIGMLPRHLLEGVDLNTASFNRHPVGTGPYVFKEWKTAEKIVLEANPRYFEGRPWIDRYVYRIIPDQAAQFLALQKGEVDAMGLTPDQFAGAHTSEPGYLQRFYKFRYPAFSYTYVGYNLKLPLFADRRVRAAIAHAIDKKAIIASVLRGLGCEATGPFPPRSWANDPEVRSHPFDPALARALLLQAGWKPGKDGRLANAKGDPFTFEIMTNQGNKVREQCATIIQQQLGQVGIMVKVTVLAWQAFLERVNRRKFDAVLLGWSLGMDPDCYDIWHSSKTRPEEYNFVSYANPKVDRLLEEGRSTFDLEKRKAIYRRIHRILAEDQPYCFLYVPDALITMDRRVKNVRVEASGIGHNFPWWFVPQGQQKYAH